MIYIILIFAVVCFTAAIVMFYKLNKQRAYIERLTAEIDKFMHYPKEQLPQILDEGYMANLENTISQMEKYILNMYEAKNVREKEIENFVENMAHQIMNAITALQIQLDILQIKDDNSIKTTVQKSQACVDRMHWEIDRILRSSQLASGKIKMIYEQIDMEKVISDCLIKLQPMIKEKNVIIKSGCPKGFKLTGDGFWIAEAFENIVKNAVEHTKMGSTVEITVKDQIKDICITISDQGNGIPNDRIGSIFDRFIRFDNKKRGYGIGLSMAKDIIQAHHGSIRMENRRDIDSGAAITIVLPVLDSENTYK